MIEMSTALDQLERKYNLTLPAGFKAEVLGLTARRHIELISLHQEIFSKPGMWRDQGEELTKIAVDMFKTQEALAALNEGDRKSRWYDKLVMKRNGRNRA